MARQDEIIELVKRVRPYSVNHLYRYRHVASRELPLIFEGRHVHFADPTTFNDPFECRPYLIPPSSLEAELYLRDLARTRYPLNDKKAIKKIARNRKRKLLDHDFLEKVYENYIKLVGVYCLSEKEDDILMWSHYSDKHRGVCIEFDSSKKDTLFWEGTKVVYQEDYPKVKILHLGNPQYLRNSLLTKSNHWEYEQERRILRFEREGGPGNYKFPAELLTGVILGASIQQPDREKIINWIISYPKRINVYQAKISRTKYKLDIEQIE